MQTTRKQICQRRKILKNNIEKGVIYLGNDLNDLEAMLFVGFSFALFLGIDKLFINPSARLITDRPEFFIALIAMVLGSQLFLAGFLGELILRSKKDSRNYIIKETVNQ